jgi:hypothetical protein
MSQRSSETSDAHFGGPSLSPDASETTHTAVAFFKEESVLAHLFSSRYIAVQHSTDTTVNRLSHVLLHFS